MLPRIAAAEKNVKNDSTIKKEGELYLTIVIESEEERELDLEVNYFQKKVNWYPAYTLRVDLDTKTLNLKLYAIVNQNTGEDWEDVEITHVFSVKSQASIPSGIKTHRLLIKEASLSCTPLYETIPEAGEFIYLKGDLTNSLKIPLLAGDIHIYKNKSYLGKATLPYTAENEKLTLSFGTDNDLKIKRLVKKDNYLKAAGLQSKNRLEREISIQLYSLKATAETVVVKEAVFSSELKEVTVKIDKSTTKGFTPGKDGICETEVILEKPYQIVSLVLAYKVESAKQYDLSTIIT